MIAQYHAVIANGISLYEIKKVELLDMFAGAG